MRSESRGVVQHASLEDTEEKTNTTDAVDIMDESRTDGSNTEAERNARNKPSRSEPFAADVGGDLFVVSLVVHAVLEFQEAVNATTLESCNSAGRHKTTGSFLDHKKLLQIS